MLRTKMNLLAYPCTKTAKMIVIRSRESENAVRKISYRRSPLHKIFKNCQIQPFFNFLAKCDKIWPINGSHQKENRKLSGMKKKIFEIGQGVPILDIMLQKKMHARARARAWHRSVFGNSASSWPILKFFFFIPLNFQFSF